MSNLQLCFSHFCAWLKKEQTWPHFCQYLLACGQDSTVNKYYQTKSMHEIHKIILTMVTSGNS